MLNLIDVLPFFSLDSGRIPDIYKLVLALNPSHPTRPALNPKP